MISLLFFLTTAFANSGTEWRFENVNKHGFKETFILQKNAGAYSFNGKSLGKNLNASEQRIWKTVTLGPQKEVKRPCIGGDFTFTITSNKSAKSRQGCADGSYYAKYRIAIDQLHELAKGKK